MPSTPPLSPTSSRDAACHHECSHRSMGSPKNHRIPSGPSVPFTSTPSLNQHPFRVLPTDLSTRLSSIPPHDHQNGAHASTSAFTLASPPIIISMAAPAPAPAPLTFSQLLAAYAALPPFNPRFRLTPHAVSIWHFYFNFLFLTKI